MDGDLSFEKLWSDAETRFQARTQKSLRGSPPKSLDDVMDDLKAKLDGEEAIKKADSKKHMLTVVQDVLTFLQLLGGIVAVGASQIFGATNMCFNAISYLCSTPSRIKQLYEGLADLFGEISCFLQEFKIYRRIEEVVDVDLELKSAIHKVLICFVDICACCIKILGDSRWQRAKIVAKKALFDDDSGVKDALAKFRALVNHKGRITDAITLEHVLRSQHDSSSSTKALFNYLRTQSDKTGQQLSTIVQSVKDVQETMKGQKNANNTAQVKGLLDWLSTSDPSIYLEEAFEKHVYGTGNWLMESSEFQGWMSGPRRSLVLHGVAGSGKTVLCATTIRYLQRITSGSASRSLCYYFFRNQLQQTANDLLGHIIRSLCNPDVEELRVKRHAELRRLFTGKYLRGEAPSEDDLLNFLAGVTERTYIVVDAIDEYGKKQSRSELVQTRRRIAKILSRLCGIDNIRLLVSCRDGSFLDEIKRVLRGSDSIPEIVLGEIAMEKSLVNADIERLIDERLDENLRDFLDEYEGWREKIRLRVKPDGMFLLVARQLDIIEQRILDSREWVDIEKSLEELPEDVNGVYSVILSNIATEKRRLALTILNWLICAQRPLHILELKDLISTIHRGPFNVLETFSNLLMKRRDAESEDVLVEFAHDTSIREYLLSNHSEEFHIDIQEAQGCFARTCISYLKIPMPEKPHGPGEVGCNNCPKRRQALEYVTNNWYKHALSMPSNTKEIVTSSKLRSLGHENLWGILMMSVWESMARLILLFWGSLMPFAQMMAHHWNSCVNSGDIFQEESHGESMVEWSEVALRSLEQSKGPKEPYQTKIRMAAFSGYKLVTKLLVAHGGHVQAPKESHDALMAASMQSYPAMIALLLGRKVDEISKPHWWLDNTGDEGDSTADEVIAAAIVQLLLDHKANPNAKNKFQQTALHLAAGNNQKLAVGMLLDRVTDPDAKDYCGATALHWAAAGGCQEALRVLVAKGLDIDARSVYRKSKKATKSRNTKKNIQTLEDYMLIGEAENANESAALELINRGANPRATDQYGSTALHWASCRGFNQLARLLIKLGADVNAARPYEKYAKTPLIEATRSANITDETIRYYLGAGADPNIEDSTWFENRTALHEAAMCGNEPIVRVLLDFGADANIRDLKGQTAADLALANGHDEVHNLLEKSNQGISARGGKGETALHMAAENNHYEVIAELLEHRAKVNVSADNSRTVLHSAAGHASAELFCLLMDKGASVTLLADNRWSVLHEAAQKGNLDVLRLLLQQPAVNLNAKDSNGATPLAVAAISKQEAAFRILLEQKAIKVDTRDWRGHTPLQNTSIAGQVTMVELLLSTGDVDVNSRETHYDRTPLLHAAQEGHLDTVHLLLEHGANIDIEDRFGCSALEYATSNGHTAVVQTLQMWDAREEVKKKASQFSQEIRILEAI